MDNPPPVIEGHVTLEEAAFILELRPRTVLQLIGDNKYNFKRKRVGKRLYFEEKDLRDYLEKRRTAQQLGMNIKPKKFKAKKHDYWT